MDWIVLSYSLPSQPASTPRVTLWRRLRRLGAVSPTGGVYVLPAMEECVEAFQWLAQEIHQAHGETLLMRVPEFEGLEDSDLVDLFCQARGEEYEEIAGKLEAIEAEIAEDSASDGISRWQNSLARLQRQYAEISRIDYFRCPQGVEVETRLKRIAQSLENGEQDVPEIRPLSIMDYRGRRWVTRPRPHVDRLACAWLIRRFIDPTASIRYALDLEQDEVPFDTPGAELGHQGNLCSFETMLRAFNLSAVGLHLLAEIVHEIDLRDGRFQRPETSGVEAILKGWLQTDMPDDELEQHGIALFEGLFQTMSPPGRPGA